MNIPLLVFVVVALVFVGVAGWLMRGVFVVIAQLAADHARVYAVSYVKASVLIAITMGACFTETFSNVTKEMAAQLPWWGWTILFWKPLAAGGGTLVAFLDRSAQTASAKREQDSANGTPSPFATVPAVKPPSP